MDPSDDSWPEVPRAAVPGRLFKGGNALSTYSDGEGETFALPPQVDIRGIDALSADDAYATGMRYPVKGGHPVTYPWDGTTWTLLEEAPHRRSAGKPGRASSVRASRSSCRAPQPVVAVSVVTVVDRSMSPWLAWSPCASMGVE
ncbi:hypothetical protein [Streptomyces sp. NRRL WC-3549]|uniref:hypothetical protein n=1 Tax=Streptomyces sp. NRRL WC-3549 TaxID=1463925 RepID=UPI000AA5B6A4|nr:hypothetical protein [Streptomyces sp. NRRL WC-3549]